jgi:hypothetical protein
MSKAPRIDHVPVFGDPLVVRFVCDVKGDHEIRLTVCCNENQHSNDNSLYSLALEQSHVL